MKSKLCFRILIDVCLTILLLLQMSYMLAGEKLHEWLGTVMFLLFAVHLYLNWNWIKGLNKGTYSVLRIAQTIVNIVIFICVISLMLSGIFMSKYVFSFLSIQEGMKFARTLHMRSAYWGFIFMSIHIGLHWSMIINLHKKQSTKMSSSKRLIYPILAVCIFIYGIFSFISHDISSYLFLNNQFVYFDTSIPLPFFLLQYTAMMGTFVFVTYYVKVYLQAVKKWKR